MPTKIPCADHIIEVSEGRYDRNKAALLIRQLADRAKAFQKEKGISIDEAVAKILEREKQKSKLAKEASTRASLFAIRAQQVAYDAVINRTGKGKASKTLGDALIGWVDEMNNAGDSYGGKFGGRFKAELEEKGLWDAFGNMKEQDVLDVMTDGFELSYGRPVKTANKLANAVAESFTAITRERNAALRKHGAFIHEAEGWFGSQTHSKERLNAAGKVGSAVVAGRVSRLEAAKRLAQKFNADENQTNAYTVWRDSLDEKGVIIDWDRTLPSSTNAEKEEWLESYFHSIYSGVHGATTDLTKEGRAGMATYQSRIEGQRLLWFADAESQFKYNGMWGNQDLASQIRSAFTKYGKDIAVAQYLSLKPEETFPKIVRHLEETAREMGDAQKQDASLRNPNIKTSLDIALGKSGESNWISKTARVLKDLTISTKGIGMIFSIPGDRAIIDSDGILRGIPGMVRISNQLGRHVMNLPGEQGKQLARATGWIAHTAAGINVERYGADTTIGRSPLSKAVEWIWTTTGVHKATDDHRLMAIAQNMQHLGSMADKNWDAMPEVEKAIFLKANDISPATWDAIRSTKFEIENKKWDMKWDLLSPDKMQEIADHLIDRVLAEKGVKTPTPDARARERDMLESKMRHYYINQMNELVPTPGLREKLVMRGNDPQNTYSGALRSLFFTFKGFGLTVAMRNARKLQALNAAGLRYKMGTYAAALVAESAILGYMGWSARELLTKGRTLPNPMNDDGTIDGQKASNILWESVKRGGGFGIYGDYLMGEYDKSGKSFLSNVSGPVLGGLDPLASAVSSAIKAITGRGRESERPGFSAKDAVAFAEQNVPYLNFIYTKWAFDHFVLWNIKEMTSPGSIQRTEDALGEKYGQRFIVEPRH